MTKMIVVDWNVLRGSSSRAGIPGDYMIVVPDVLFEEAALAREEHRGNNIRNLTRHLKNMKPQRLCIGKQWTEISRHESSATPLTDRLQIVHVEFTNRMRELLSNDEAAAFEKRLAVLSDEETAVEVAERRAEFLNVSREFFDLTIKDHEGELRDLANDRSRRHAWIREPSRAVSYIINGNPRMSPPAWREQLTSFPDRLAIGRWARILIWYALEYAIKAVTNPIGPNAEHNFGNNWEDSHYAFLASYCDAIVTKDKGLTEAVTALFPAVAIHQTLEAG